MKLASLFDGIAGFPLAAQRAGIETTWTADIDPQCRSVSARHFPGALQLSDVRAALAMLETKNRGRFATQLVRPDIITGGYGVRRLTPRECERLQGYPDDWTRYGHDGREMSDSARYRMLGNSIAVPCVEWIMRRITTAFAGAA